MLSYKICDIWLNIFPIIVTSCNFTPPQNWNPKCQGLTLLYVIFEFYWECKRPELLLNTSSNFQNDGKKSVQVKSMHNWSALEGSWENESHPALKRQDRLGKEPFAGFGTVVEDITESGYTKNQPILLGPFWENAFFVFLHYKINGSKGVFWP